MWDTIRSGVSRVKNFFKHSLMSNSDEWNIQGELKQIEERLPDQDDDTEVKKRFDTWRRKDPYPDVPASLLNASQFCEYVVKTGMIHPFYPEEDKIKIATYEVGFKGKYIFWNENGREEYGEIEEGENFVLKKNSIAFVTLEPYFRIPGYIAPRFNLKISHVYKGLLLGTGPIVDPGFEGRLSIPLHNLTNNDYKFRGGEGLISMEFTKLSKHPHIEDGNERVESKLFIPFSDEKKKKVNRDVIEYLNKATSHWRIRSSLAPFFKDVEETVEKVRSRSFAVFISAIITVAVGLTTIAGLVFDLGQAAVREFDSSIDDKVEMIDSHEATIDSLRMRIRALENDE